jgi:hypothetical protein
MLCKLIKEHVEQGKTAETRENFPVAQTERRTKQIKSLGSETDSLWCLFISA